MSTNKNLKDQYVIEFIKSFKAVEDEMEPFKEHRRELKKTFVENNYLTREEVRMAVKAYRMLKSYDDFDKFSEIYEQISNSYGMGDL